MKKFTLLAFASLTLIGSVGTCEAKAQSQIYVPKYFVQLSRDTNVPADILYALTVKESNTKMDNDTMSPWPFTINYKGKGYRYANYEQMILAARELLAKGHTAFDIGAFQVNWKWNGDRAESLEALGHPYKNGLVAAEILLEKYEQYGNWCVAAGRYHNPANKNGYADIYGKEYCRVLRNIQSGVYQKSLVNKIQTTSTN